MRRFIKEARLLAKLCAEPHPHIVRVTDLFEEGDTHCLVMDFIPGESLFSLYRPPHDFCIPRVLFLGFSFPGFIPIYVSDN